MNDTTLPPEFSLKVLEVCPMGILVTDREEKILWCNSTLTTWLNATKDQHIGSKLNTFLQNQFHVEDDKPDYLAIYDSRNKPSVWLQHTTLQMDLSGNAYNVVFLAEVNSNIELLNRLNQLETVEPVSGLLNRRAMLQNLDPLVSRSRRYENPLSIIALELTNFQDIKSSHGQDAADNAILEISHLLKDQLRWADIISRVDDNNIVIILPETEREDAKKLASKISNQIAELNITHDDTDTITLSACYGISAWKKGHDSLMFLRNANNALAEAKEKGPGTVVME